MSKTPEGNVLFCQGCASQGNFIGNVEEKSAQVTAGPTGNSLSGTLNSSQLKAEVTFVDRDGGRSKTAEAYIHPRDFEGTDAAGLVDEDYKFTDVQGATEVLRSAAETAATKLEARIGRCAHIAMDAQGNRYCPAFGPEGLGGPGSETKEMFSLMVNGSLSNKTDDKLSDKR